ncbi:MAG: S8 family serine peptidase [Dehalococcoidia bacterium]
MPRLVVLLTAVLAFASVGGARLPATAAEPVPEYVVVQVEQAEARAQSIDGIAPSLADQGFQRVAVPPGYTADQYAAELQALPGFVSVVPDARAYAAALPDDPLYTLNQATYFGLIKAPAAWDLSTGAGHEVIVAVLDSGMDTRHPEFSSRAWENTRDASRDGIDDDSNGCVDDLNGCRFVDLTSANRDGCGYTSSAAVGNILDDHGRTGADQNSHGTLVAGIIGASGNNGAGITGVSWNVRIMPVKVLDCGPTGSPTGSVFNVAQGIDYARRMGARIINLSLAANGSTADSPVLRKAVADAEAQGIIIVAAAGNHSPASSDVGPGYPAAYTQFANVVAVGASDLNGNWATFSNYGPSLDLAAPGVSIASTTRTDLGFAAPYGSDTRGGTSFSTPLVTGVIALGIARNPNLPMGDYLDALYASASPAPPAAHGQNWAGAGIVDAGKFVARIPLTLSGSALRDFKDVPFGTELRAFVGGQECGRTTTASIGPVSLYTLRVRSAAEQTDCGQPGSKVRVLVGGFETTNDITWLGRDQPIGFLDQDLSAVSPAPGPVVVQVLNGGWSNIAHLDASGGLPNALAGFASSWSAVFRWDPTGEGVLGGVYRRFVKDAPDFVNDIGSLGRYEAIWIDGARANVATPNPNPTPGRSVGLSPGWNNVVYTGSARSIADALVDSAGKYLRVMQFDNATGTWLSHVPGLPRYLNDFNGLFQLQVYWIYMTEPGEIVMR